MRIALLCSGPSIAAWPAHRGEAWDEILAVNAAALAHLADASWVCAHDFAMLRALAQVMGAMARRPRVYASRHAVETLADWGELLPPVHRSDREMGLHEWDFTVIGALRLAGWLAQRAECSAAAPAQVHAWGMDLAGDTYGVPSATPPRPADWSRIAERLPGELATLPQIHLIRHTT